ncbi:MAG TPA: 16S rRNA (adenine(1518)-N(6)/adenine(1519)-N(6))-dimethyltransferase RsmA, partial [Acidimicrobiales bacterium]|nr:16S rRNA (adenine(1518)-N(6)/adenine(1519)-N(6))-dimethyltransferase RsmA [Acidimicrobiales bacterium]
LRPVSLRPRPPLLGRADIQKLLADNGLRPSRALGQNFVADPNTVARIARLSGIGPADAVVEIGAGLGSLTLALAATGARVTAVEIDKYLAPILRAIVEPAGVTVVEGDALRLDWGSVLSGAESWTLVANLPYNVATPLVATLLESVPAITSMLVMVQREVGERLAAGAGEDAYGAVSVKVAYFASAKVVGKVGADVFVPRPNVESALVHIRRRDSPAVDPTDVPYDFLFSLVRAGFAVRRKMLRRSLAGLVDSAAFELAGIDPTARAEMLGVEAWGTLARCQIQVSTGNTPTPS